MEDTGVRIWDATADFELQECNYGHNNTATCVTISSDGLLVTPASVDKTLRVCARIQGHIFSGSQDTTLRLWDTEKFTQIGDPFRGHTGMVDCASFSTDGFRIVSASQDCTVRLWNVQTGEKSEVRFIDRNLSLVLHEREL